jgi:hypothetical protein
MRQRLQRRCFGRLQHVERDMGTSCKNLEKLRLLSV